MAKSLNQIDSQSFDVVVSGAGMVGASAAVGLSQLGLKVLLIDAFAIPFEAPAYTPSYDARSTALSWGSREIFQQLGVWQLIQPHATAISRVHVSQKGRFGTTRMDAREVGYDALGYVVPNQAIGQSLLSVLAMSDISAVSPSSIIELDPTTNGYTLTLADADRQARVDCRLLLICDGSNSRTAQKLGIEYEETDYSQHALIANISTSSRNDGVAYERFTPEGPLALLPLGPQSSALVWTHDASEIDRYMSLSDEAFLAQLQAAFGDRLGRVTYCGERSSYPLKLVRAREQYRPGILVLGNAAHSLHPVAGQGFNLALRGVARMLEEIASHGPANHFKPSAGLLRRICERQREDQNRTIMFSDQLVKVFGAPSISLGLAREWGLVALNSLPAFKQLFATMAMGLAEPQARWTENQAEESHG